MPKAVSSHLYVGPVVLGESERAIVNSFGSIGQDGINQTPAFLMYADGRSVILFNFDRCKRLARVVINPGPIVEGHRIPRGIPDIEMWQWEGGTVSRPPSKAKLEVNKAWRAEVGVAGEWTIHEAGCVGIVSYQSDGGYTFQMGPVVCNKI